MKLLAFVFIFSVSIFHLSAQVPEYKREATFNGIPPMYPGGSEYKKEFIRSQMKYPESAAQQKIEGIVELSFVVEEDGTLTNIQIVSDPGGGLGEEALRIYEHMPKWVPGSLHGRPTRVPVTESITFRLRSYTYRK